MNSKYLGCKKNILYILVTLFSTWKQKKNSFFNFLPSFTIWKQIKPLVFFMGISTLLLVSQNNLCHIIWTSKSTPKVSPTIMSFFRGVGMILVMKTNSSTQKIILIHVHHINIEFMDMYILIKTSKHVLFD